MTILDNLIRSEVCSEMEDGFKKRFSNQEARIAEVTRRKSSEKSYLDLKKESDNTKNSLIEIDDRLEILKLRFKGLSIQVSIEDLRSFEEEQEEEASSDDTK